jgi:hypothetical protein
MANYPTSPVILIYLVSQKLEFHENKYLDKGRRIGTLIEEGPARWGFHPERSTGGLTAELLFSIVTELIRLNARSLPSPDAQEASQATLGNIVPEPPSDAL